MYKDEPDLLLQVQNFKHDIVCFEFVYLSLSVQSTDHLVCFSKNQLSFFYYVFQTMEEAEVECKNVST